jgi:hypothetical protein
LAVRPGDRPPFKAWDELAIVAMLEAASPMVRSWRDWSSVRLEVVEDIVKKCGIAAGQIEEMIARETSRIGSNLQGLKRSIWLKMVLDQLEKQDTVQHRVLDKIPRSESLEAFTRNIAATAYELAHLEFRSWSVVHRVIVLAETRHGSDSEVIPLACHHAFDEQPIPEAGTTGDPRVLPGSIAEGCWRGFFDEGQAREFSCDGKSGMIIPFHAWVGGQAQRGALSLELKGEGRDLRGIRDDLMILARRVAAGWTVLGSSIKMGKFAAKTQAGAFVERILDHLNADYVFLDINGAYGRSASSPKWAVQRDDDYDWCVPAIGFERPERRMEFVPDPSCELWEIEQSVRDGEVSLRIPLRHGVDHVGYIIAGWNGAAWKAFLDDPHAVRSNWVHSILSAWALWSWSWAKVLTVTCKKAKDGQVEYPDSAALDLQGNSPTVASLSGNEPVSQETYGNTPCLVGSELDHLRDSSTIGNLIGTDARSSNPAHAA